MTHIYFEVADGCADSEGDFFEVLLWIEHKGNRIPYTLKDFSDVEDAIHYAKVQSKFLDVSWCFTGIYFDHVSKGGKYFYE